MSCTDCLLINFFISLFATIVGIFCVLLIERKIRPRISMEKGEPGRIVDEDPLKRQPCTWLNIQIHNKSAPRWLAWAYDGRPALTCRAWITFHHFPDGYRVFDREMNARWNETAFPEVQEIPTENGTVFTLSNVQETVDIPPGEYLNINVVFRAKDEDVCYGRNNEGFLYDWRHPAWRLEKGRYIAKVTVKTAGRKFVDAFLIVNDVQYEDFRIEPVSKEIKERLR